MTQIEGQSLLEIVAIDKKDLKHAKKMVEGVQSFNMGKGELESLMSKLDMTNDQAQGLIAVITRKCRWNQGELLEFVFKHRLLFRWQTTFSLDTIYNFFSIQINNISQFDKDLDVETLRFLATSIKTVDPSVFKTSSGSVVNNSKRMKAIFGSLFIFAAVRSEKEIFEDLRACVVQSQLYVLNPHESGCGENTFLGRTYEQYRHSCKPRVSREMAQFLIDKQFLEWEFVVHFCCKYDLPLPQYCYTVEDLLGATNSSSPNVTNEYVLKHVETFGEVAPLYFIKIGDLEALKRYQQEGDRTFSLYVLNSAFKNKQQIPSDIASFLVQHMDENMAQQDQIWFKEAHDKTFPLHGERLLEMISAGNLDEAKAKVSAAISLDISKEHCESIVAQLDRKQDESKELIKAIINHQHVPLESLLYLCHRFDLDPPQRRYTVYCIRTSGVPVAFVQKHLTVLGLEPALIHLVKIDALDALKAYQNDGGKTFPYSLVIDALNTNNSRKPNKAIVDFLKQHMNEQNLQDFERDYLEKRYKQLFSGQ